MNLNDVKYKEKFLKIFTPRMKKNKRNFEQVLYPEKRPPTLSCEIINKEKIVSLLAENMDKIFYDNENFSSKKKDIYNNSNYNSKQKNKNNLIKRNRIRPSILSPELIKRSSFYLNKFMNKRISKSRNNNFPFQSENKKQNGINFISSKDKNYSLKKIKSSLINKKETKKIINRNLVLNLSNLTESNINKKNFQNKKTMKKAISSNVLNNRNSLDSSNNFKNNKNNHKFNLISFNSPFRKKSNENILSIYNLKPCESNITFTNYMLSYTDRNTKHDMHKTNYRKFTNDFYLNKDINSLSSSKKNIYNNYNQVYSKEDEPQKENNINKNVHNFSNSLSKVNKIKLLNKIKKGNPNNLKQNADNFKNFFNNKIKSLNNMIHNRNKKLLELIDTNNQIINTTKEINLKRNEKLKDELDIRKDLLDKNGKIYTENGVKVNLNKENKNYIINPTKEELIQKFNLLKKNINKISSSEALDIIEKCFDKDQKEKLDVQQLLVEYNNNKIKKELFKIEEIRKKAERNYKKMIKMKYNL